MTGPLLRIRTELRIAGEQDPPVFGGVRGYEALGRPFRYEVAFNAVDLDFDAARGGNALIHIEDESGLERYVSGFVERISTRVGPVSLVDEGRRYRAILRPKAYLVLSHRRGFRIFQDLDTVEIVKKVFEDAGLESDLFEWGGVSGTHVERAYCVQYDETEWDFVSRLLEDEGIYYWFEHDAAGHRMVFCDDNAGSTAFDPATLEYTVDTSTGRLWNWTASVRVTASKATVRDFDLLRPSVDLTAEATAEQLREREHYEYPGGYVDPGEGSRRARARLDEARTPAATSRCSTDALDLRPGHFFEVLQHPSRSGEFLVTGVELVVAAHDEPLAKGASPVSCRLELIPKEQQFRPARLAPKPAPAGFQTARVTGPAGQEIHCDDLGRVKVQFHWDREGKLDEHTSCWLRVIQPHTTGSLHIPRIGWEVLVELVDGDPDRPICLGRVWNPNYPPPVALPDLKSQHVYGGVSSPGAGCKNTITLDDTSGSEMVSIQAGKNMSLVAANNRKMKAGKTLSNDVTGSRTATVGGNETASVGSDLEHTIGGDHTITVDASRLTKTSGVATESITGSLSLTVGGMEMIKVGSVTAAVLELVASAAIEAASGAAASAAERATGALMGPIMPALGAAKAALGPAAQFAGPAAAMLGSGSPNVSMFGEAVGALSKAPGAADVGAMASSMAAGALSGALAEAGAAAASAAGGPTGAMGGGTGTWGLVAGGSLTESVGGLCAYNSPSGIGFSIGGSTKEMVGGARVELIRGGKAETTGGAKAEQVGIYKVVASGAISASAKAMIAYNVAGSRKVSVSGTYAIAATGPVQVKASQLKLKGTGTIILKSGDTKVTVSSSGIAIDGASKVEIKGGKIEADGEALGS